MFKFGAIHGNHLVGAVLPSRLYGGIDMVADDQAYQGTALLFGQLTAGAQEFQADVASGAIGIGLNKYPKISRFSFHLISLLR